MIGSNKSMTDEDYNKQKERIMPLIDKWKNMMRLNQLQINIVWDRSYSSEPPNQAASTMMDKWKYLEFDITFYLPACAEENDKAIESLVVHELVHCLLAPISTNMRPCSDDYQADLMELNTSQVQSALLGTRDNTKGDQ